MRQLAEKRTISLSTDEESQKRGSVELKRLKPLIITALMAALAVILTRYASLRVSIGPVEGIRLGIGSLPNILIGMILGPAYGAVAGAVADVVGFILSPIGGYMPHFTLTAALLAAIPGAVFRLLQPSGRATAKIVPVALGIAAGTVAISWGLTPYFLHTLFGLNTRVILLPRIVAGLIELPLYTVVVKAVYDRTRSLVRER